MLTIGHVGVIFVRYRTFEDFSCVISRFVMTSCVEPEVEYQLTSGLCLKIQMPPKIINYINYALKNSMVEQRIIDINHIFEILNFLICTIFSNDLDDFVLTALHEATYTRLAGCIA